MRVRERGFLVGPLEEAVGGEVLVVAGEEVVVELAALVHRPALEILEGEGELRGVAGGRLAHFVGDLFGGGEIALVDGDFDFDDAGLVLLAGVGAEDVVDDLLGVIGERGLEIDEFAGEIEILVDVEGGRSKRDEGEREGSEGDGRERMAHGKDSGGCGNAANLGGRFTRSE